MAANTAPRKTPHTYTSNTPSVSCLIVSRGDRISFLDITRKCLAAQTYPNILEFVFVNGSQSAAEADAFDDYCARVLRPALPNAVFGPWIGPRTIGAYRNECNRRARGEILVCFDDDDYYYPQRVQHTVERLVASGGSLAGCDDHLIYDVDMDLLCRATKTGVANLVCNNTMAYTAAFARSHAYDETRTHAEEPSFIGNESVVSLMASNSTVQFAHVSNTYGKQRLLLEAVLKAEGLAPVSSTERCDLRLEDVIQDATFRIDMCQTVLERNAAPPIAAYDIVYYAGWFQPEWDPAARDLGGSEQAIVGLATCWAAQGYSVAVYANIPHNCVREGVHYFRPNHFSLRTSYKVLILWRISGCSVLPLHVRARTLYVDFHDAFYDTVRPFLRKYSHKVHGFFFKSKYHAESFDETVELLHASRRHIIPNGVRIAEFTPRGGGAPERDPFRFVYASAYNRGLLWMVKGLWPIIEKLEPRAELHVYYGFDSMRGEPPELQQLLLEAFATGRIMDHGRQPLEHIVREKQRAGFHLYPCVSPAEVDCISVRESLAAGCIPILTRHGVFQERDGFFIEFDIRDPSTLLKPAIEIVKLARDRARCDALREKLAASPTLVSWSVVAKNWAAVFKASEVASAAQETGASGMPAVDSGKFVRSQASTEATASSMLQPGSVEICSAGK